jgi:hypothetical protein
MNIPFNIKFTIFDVNNSLTKKQIKIRNNLLNRSIDNDMKNILKKAISELNNIKFLDRVEPAICSNDEKKQLRISLSLIIKDFTSISKKYHHSIHFNQKHSQCNEYFSIEELKSISNSIKNELENYLQYEINAPILYIELDDL